MWPSTCRFTCINAELKCLSFGWHLLRWSHSIALSSLARYNQWRLISREAIHLCIILTTAWNDDNPANLWPWALLCHTLCDDIISSLHFIHIYYFYFYIFLSAVSIIQLNDFTCRLLLWYHRLKQSKQSYKKWINDKKGFKHMCTSDKFEIILREFYEESFSGSLNLRATGTSVVNHN